MNSRWNEMMNMMQMSNNMDWRTLLGFGLGKLLRGAWDDHLKRRHRDAAKKTLDGLDSATSEGQMSYSETDPSGRSRTVEYNMPAYGSYLANQVTPSAESLGAYRDVLNGYGNSDVKAQAAQGLMNLKDMWGRNAALQAGGYTPDYNLPAYDSYIANSQRTQDGLDSYKDILSGLDPRRKAWF